MSVADSEQVRRLNCLVSPRSRSGRSHVPTLRIAGAVGPVALGVCSPRGPRRRSRRPTAQGSCVATSRRTRRATTRSRTDRHISPRRNRCCASGTQAREGTRPSHPPGLSATDSADRPARPSQTSRPARGGCARLIMPVEDRCARGCCRPRCVLSALARRRAGRAGSPGRCCPTSCRITGKLHVLLTVPAGIRGLWRSGRWPASI